MTIDDIASPPVAIDTNAMTPAAAAEPTAGTRRPSNPPRTIHGEPAAMRRLIDSRRTTGVRKTMPTTAITNARSGARRLKTTVRTRRTAIRPIQIGRASAGGIPIPVSSPTTLYGVGSVALAMVVSR